MDGTVGAAHRTQLFGWMKTRQNDLYEGQNAAAVGLVYSPRNRDLLDSGSGTWYDVVDSVHFKAYRQAANLLYRSHIPLDVVLDTDLAAFNNYSVLILPEVQAMSNATATALKNFPGKLITVGETGGYDEWLNPRAVNALAGVPQTHLAAVSSALVTAADTGLLSTTAPAAVQLGLRRIPRGYTMMLVNTAAAPTTAFDVDLRLRPGEGIAAALLSRPDAADAKVPYSLLAGLMVRLAVPAGIDSLALLTLTRGDQSWLPLLLD
jgi:hypothetical protein